MLTESHILVHSTDFAQITYVTLELGAVDPSLIPSCASMRLIVRHALHSASVPYILEQGLETPTPFLQLGDSVFKGVHVSSLGTELLFHDATRTSCLHSVFPSNRPSNLADGPSRSLSSLAQTEHKILFNPVTLTPKAAPAAEPEPASETPRDPETARPAYGGGALTQSAGGQGLRDAAPVPLAGRPRGRGRGKGKARQA